MGYHRARLVTKHRSWIQTCFETRPWASASIARAGVRLGHFSSKRPPEAIEVELGLSVVFQSWAASVSSITGALQYYGAFSSTQQALEAPRIHGSRWVSSSDLLRASGTKTSPVGPHLEVSGTAHSEVSSAFAEHLRRLQMFFCFSIQK